jgi:hypothetical protein
MKRSLSILISAAAIFALGAVAVVRAQDVSSNDDGTVVSESQDANSNVNAGSDVEVNSNVNAEPSPVPEAVMGMEGNHGEDANMMKPVPTLYSSEKPPAPPAGNEQAGNGLMKIPHPGVINLYTKIKQIGNSLYGILKNGTPHSGTDSSQEGSSSGAEQKSGEGAQGTAQQLEKILRPDLMKFYTSIKKIGTSLFGIRTGKLPADAVKHPVVTADQSACVIAAIQTKDEAVVSAKTAEATAFNAAVTARTACQTSALGSVEGQQAALAKCVAEFAKSGSASREAFAKAQNEAWKTYVTALKSCSPSAEGSGSSATEGAEIMVEDGGNSL